MLSKQSLTEAINSVFAAHVVSDVTITKAGKRLHAEWSLKYSVPYLTFANLLWDLCERIPGTCKDNESIQGACGAICRCDFEAA